MQRMGVEIVVGNLQINYVFEITGNEGGNYPTGAGKLQY